MSRKKTYVLDTSVYLTNAECIYAFKNNDIHVPLKVFEEIDKHKKRQDAVGAQARKIIRIWDDLRTGGSLDKGVRIRKGLGIVKSISAAGVAPEDLPCDLDIKIPDHLIIATALKAQRESDRNVILVSRDINMRVIADAVGLTSEDFQNNQVVDRLLIDFTKDKMCILKPRASFQINMSCWFLTPMRKRRLLENILAPQCPCASS